MKAKCCVPLFKLKEDIEYVIHKSNSGHQLFTRCVAWVYKTVLLRPKRQCSHQSVGRVVSALEKAGIGHKDIKNMASTEILSLLHTPTQQLKKYREIDFKRVAHTLFHKKKSKYRATITLLYLEYVEVDPKTAYSKSRFFAKVKEFTRQYTATMRQLRRYGELLNIDYAGMQVFYFENGVQAHGLCLRCLYGLFQEIVCDCHTIT